MSDRILVAASAETKKVFFEPDFMGIPEEIAREIKATCIIAADRLGAVFVMGFHDDGTIYFEFQKSDDCLDFDDIGAELEIKRIKSEKRELLAGLQLWYVVTQTEKGEEVARELLKKAEKDTEN